MFSIIVSSLPAAKQARTHRRRTRQGCLSVDLVSRRCGMFLFRDRESSAGNSISTLMEATMSDVRARVRDIVEETLARPEKPCAK